MSQTSPTRVEQRPADLKALNRQLAEIAARANRADRPDRDRREHAEGPMIVVRGK
jgi:predicted RNA-binding Zn ribbon-like protein